MEKTKNAFPQSSFVSKQLDDGFGFDNLFMGLTNREYYAVNIMAALIQNPERFQLYNDDEFASRAVRLADLLIKRLNENY